MSDQCKHCSVRRHLKYCKLTDCYVHKSWYAVKIEEENGKLIDCLKWALEWIDAVPCDTVLPTMPGFDREYIDLVINEAKQNEE